MVEKIVEASGLVCFVLGKLEETLRTLKASPFLGRVEDAEGVESLSARISSMKLSTKLAMEF